MIISLPVQTAVWYARAEGAFHMDMDVQTFAAGLNRLPSRATDAPLRPPHMSTSLPVHTSEALVRAAGGGPWLPLSHESAKLVAPSFIYPAFAKSWLSVGERINP